METKWIDVAVRFICCTHGAAFEPKFDAEGFLICPLHNARRYGWLSPRQRLYKSVPFDPEDPKYIMRLDYDESPIQRDRAIVRELVGK